MVVPLDVSRPKSVKALEEAMASQHLVFVASQKRADIEDPQEDDLFLIGTTAKILELLKMPNGQVKILVEGHARGKVVEFRHTVGRGFIEVDIEVLEEKIEKTPDIEAHMRQASQLFEQYIKLNRRISIEASVSLNNIEDPARFTDVIAGNLLIKMSDKQLLLEILAPRSVSRASSKSCMPKSRS